MLEAAFVLHRRPYRDSSLTAELLTEGEGRIGLVARGARRPRSKAACVNQLFQPLAASWVGKGDMGTLVHAEATAPPWLLQGQVLFSGLYINELLVRVLPRHAPCPEIFSLYAEVMVGLTGAESNGAAIQRELRWFEVQLLQLMGYGLDLARDSGSGGHIDENRSYLYRHGLGIVPNEDSIGSDEGIVVSGRTLIGLHTRQLAQDWELREAKRLMRFVLSEYIGHRPLNSREVFKAFLHHRNGTLQSGRADSSI